MSWYRKYWDSIDQIYWDPSILGLVSISNKKWKLNDDEISIPRDQVAKGGSIYTRRGTAAENALRMQRLEEPLNHIFDITFGIAGDAVIQSLFYSRFGIDALGKIDRLGREVMDRYPGFKGGTTTQQDALFASEDAVLGVELKLGSPTWQGQALKYLALMVAEEKHRGARGDLGLLYVTPRSDITEISAVLGLDQSGKLPEGFIDRVPPSQISKTLGVLIESNREHFESAALRLQVRHVSWSELIADVGQIVSSLSEIELGDQTLKNLLLGFVDAVKHHDGCMVGDPD